MLARKGYPAAIAFRAIRDVTGEARGGTDDGLDGAADGWAPDPE